MTLNRLSEVQEITQVKRGPNYDLAKKIVEGLQFNGTIQLLDFPKAIEAAEEVLQEFKGVIL